MSDLTKREEREKLRRYLASHWMDDSTTKALLDACDTLEQQRDAALKALAWAWPYIERPNWHPNSTSEEQLEWHRKRKQAREVLRAAKRIA